MEFTFDINNLFGEGISLVDKNLTPSNNSQNTRIEFKKQVNHVLDQMGEASAKAQGLHGAITTGSKLAFSSHHLYIMKDSESKGGKGAVLGFLKVGTKKLFIYDHYGGQHEMEPLCVLDFYVHESRQRMGCGRKLFDAMLEQENIKPHHLAIDRPSPKFLGFLNKHYNLKASIPQVNNFVVFEGFFRDRLDTRKNGRGKANKPPLHPYTKPGGRGEADTSGRPGPTKLAQLEREPSYGSEDNLSRRHHTSRLLSWDGQDVWEARAASHRSSSAEGPRKQALGDITVPRPGSREDSTLSNNSRTSSLGGLDSRSMGAQQSMYSRHNSSPSNSVGRTGNAKITGQTGSHSTYRGSSPPMLQRDGPSKDYLHLYNGSCSYQDSRGRLKLSPVSTQNPPISGSALQSGDSPANAVPQENQTRQPAGQSNSAWNVFGVTSNQPHGTSTASRRYQLGHPW